jgi:hypothetical protein
MRKLLSACLAGLLVACAQPQPVPTGVAFEAPQGFPQAYYRQAAAQGAPVLPVDTRSSFVVIEVYRGGSLARLGHDHVVASHEVRGFVAPRANRADLYIRLDQLVVDEPELRKEAGFDTQPTDEDIAGTRRNMLNSMEAEAFPYALVRITGGGASGEQTLDITLTVRGVAHTVQAPVRLETTGASLVATGRIAVKQTDFGITPLTVLGGAIQVKDEVSVRFAIRADALGQAP